MKNLAKFALGMLWVASATGHEHKGMPDQDAIPMNPKFATAEKAPTGLVRINAVPDDLGPQIEGMPAQKAIDRVSVLCGKDVVCPEGLGLLSNISHDNKVGICSGVLISPTIFVTDGACVPADLHGGDSCRDRVKISFPATGNLASEVAECGQVLSVTPTAPAALDVYTGTVAFLRLDVPVKRTPFEVDDGGMSEGEVSSFLPKIEWKTNARKQRFAQATFIQQKCEVAKRSLVLPDFLVPKNSVVLVGGCKVLGDGYKEGLAGAPFLNEQMQVTALFHQKLHLVRDDPNLVHLKRYEKIDSFVVASNLACVHLPDQPTAGLSPECALPVATTAPSELNLNKMVLPSDQKNLQAKLEAFKRTWVQSSGVNLPFKWLAGRVGAVDPKTWVQAYAPVPECVQKKPTYPNTGSPVFLPAAAVTYRLNRLLQVVPEFAGNLPGVEIRLLFEAAGFASLKNSNDTKKVTLEFVRDGVTTPIVLELSLCAK